MSKPAKWALRLIVAGLALIGVVALAQAPAIVQLFDSDVIWVLRGGVTVPANMISIKQYIGVPSGGGGGGGTGSVAVINRYPAQNYGPCAASGGLAGQDPGACIVAAYNAAVSAGGGIVVVPPGNYTGLKTPIVFSTSFVGLVCEPSGITRDASSQFRAATTITADPSMAGKTMFTMSPAVGATSYLYGMTLKGCLFNAAGVANVGVQVSNVAYSSDLQIACEEATVTCVNLHVYDLAPGAGGGQGPGNQQNRISVWFKQLTTNGTGFFLDRGSAPAGDIFYNNSYSRILSVNGNYNQGDGLVVTGSDNVWIDDVEVFNTNNGSGPGPGKACVIAPGGYVTPSGSTTIGIGGSIVISHLGAPCLVMGYQTTFAPVYVPAGVPCSGCGPTTITLGPTAGELAGSQVLPLPSTVGLTTDMGVSCSSPTAAGGNQPTVYPGDQIFSIQAGVSVTLVQPSVANMIVGATCTFGSNIRGSAAPGAYTVTYDGPTWSITAPANGHSQSGVTMSNGVAVFQDLIWMFQGVANVGDSWTYSAATPPKAIVLDGVDNLVNNVQYGVFQYGASGWARYSGTFQAILFGPQGIGTLGVSLNGGGANGLGCISSGYYAGCSGNYSASFGFSNGANGLYGMALGGNNNSESGQASQVGGVLGNDNGLYNAVVRGGGSCNGGGSCQAFQTILSHIGAGGTTVTLTGNLGTPSAAAPNLNCINLTKDNSSAAFTVTLVIQQQGAAGVAESWHNWPMLLTRGVGVGSVVLFAGATPTPLNAGLGGAVAATADTANGCLHLNATLPSGGTWTATATVAGSMAN